MIDFCSGDAGGVRQEEWEVVLQLVEEALHQPRHHRQEGTPRAAPSLWETEHKLKNWKIVSKISFCYSGQTVEEQ